MKVEMNVSIGNSRRITWLMVVGMLFSVGVKAQHKCSSHQHRMQKAAQNPVYAQQLVEAEKTMQQAAQNVSYKRDGELITVPVVVHVLYNKDRENVSDEQIQSQLNVLNKDFQLLNADQLEETHPFYSDMTDCQIEFCLATTDPDGNPHSGITRTKTDSVNFAGVGSEKFTAMGGHDNWDPYRYLNIWVCNLDEEFGTLGYSSFPTDLAEYPDEDGVVIHFRCFGTTGTAGTGDFQENNLGRTGTHEVGHWLFLEHIWGDQNCGTDGVSDTPPHEWDNYGCPQFPHNANNSCGGNANGEMFMNYMDYVDDACMVMFTHGQKKRMRDAIGVYRPKLLEAPSCSAVTVGRYPNQMDLTVQAYPNPSSGTFTLKVEDSGSIDAQVMLINSVGQIMHTTALRSELTAQQQLKVEALADGLYTLLVTTSTGTFTQQITITQ